jgi:hypothetical protein
MYRRMIALVATIAAFLLIGVAAAVAVGVPEIDNANATFQIKLTASPVITACPGEDATNYTKVTGPFKGVENDFTPGSTDYNLSGTLSWSNAVWTINQTTLRGIFRANAKLVDSFGMIVYKGKVVLITQGIPGSQTANMRGWLVANTYTAGSPDGGSVLANVDANIQTNNSYPITGLFGDAPTQLGYPNYSVTTVNQTC